MPQILEFVVIGADGTTLHASGVKNVAHLGTGFYHITFDFSVANVCEVASIGHWQQAAWITAYGSPPTGPNVVEVMTGVYEAGDASGPALAPVGADLTFQLLIVA